MKIRFKINKDDQPTAGCKRQKNFRAVEHKKRIAMPSAPNFY